MWVPILDPQPYHQIEKLGFRMAFLVASNKKTTGEGILKKKSMSIVVHFSLMPSMPFLIGLA